MTDVLIIGSGINGLSAAALLAKKGKKVLVLEQATAFGGAIRTEEVTLPGFKHDLFATNLSLFAGGGVMAELKDDLIAAGLEFVPSDKPYCSLFPDGKMIGITMDRQKNLDTLARVVPNDVEPWKALTAKLGELAPHLFPILGTELPSFAAAKSLIKTWRKIGTEGTLNLIRMLLQSSRAFTEENFTHPETKALAAIWGMHLDYGPDISGGALFSFLETIGGQEFGMVFGKGGADTLINALVKVIQSNGGELRTGVNVTEILVESDKAVGVLTKDGEKILAKNVIANVNPALLPALLRETTQTQELHNFRPGLGTMMIHLALDALPNWLDPAAKEFNYVHIAPYLDDMAIT